MKKSQKLYPSALITILTLFLGLVACTDNSTDSLTSNEEIHSSTQQTIETQSYIISIDNSSDQKLFSASNLDGEILVSMVTEEELRSRYPAVFDELAMHEVTSGSSTSIYYDDPSMNRETKSEL